MHPEILSLSLFMFVTSCSPGPNNVIASHSGFNHGVKKSIPLMMGVIFGFTTMLAVINFGLINIFVCLFWFVKYDCLFVLVYKIFLSVCFGG